MQIAGIFKVRWFMHQRKRVAVVGLVLPALLVAAGAFASSADAGSFFATGHDLDYHCTNGDDSGNEPSPYECSYYKSATAFVRNGSSLPLLILDRDSTGDGAAGSTDLASSPLEAVTSLNLAYSEDMSTTPTASSPRYVAEDPQGLQPTIINGTSPSGITTSSKWSSTPLVNGAGQPLWSAIIVASDASCGGCDLNDWPVSTLDSDAINARSSDIHSFFNAGGGLLYLAGACDAFDAGDTSEACVEGGPPTGGQDAYYASVPVPVGGEPVSPPFTVTEAGATIGITTPEANCCATHNSFAIPTASSPLRVAETDNAGLAESLFGTAGVCTIGFCKELFMSKVADSSSVAEGGTDGYTIKIVNPNASAVTVTAIKDALATGFAYRPGSSSGVTTADPTISGQTLTWSGSFLVPANSSSIRLHFDVKAPSSLGGPYDDSASALASGGGVAPTGPTAPVTVTAPVDLTPPVCTIKSITRGNPQTETVAVQDTGSGLASIFGVSIVNGTAPVPSFAAGTTSPVDITATKANQSERTVWSFYAKDEAGNVAYCN